MKNSRYLILILALIMVFGAGMADAATYRNDSNGYISIESTDGRTIQLAPGESGQTYQYYDIDNLTKTSDAPRYNPVIAQASITASGTEVSVDTAADTVVVINDSDAALSVYWGSRTNTPATPIPADSRWNFDDIRAVADKLIIDFDETVSDGQIRVLQLDRRGQGLDIGNFDTGPRTTVYTLFDGTTIAAGGSATSDAIYVGKAAGYFSLQVAITGDGTVKFEYLVSMTGEDGTFVEPSEGNDIETGLTNTAGTASDGNDAFPISDLMLAPYIQINATETGLSDSVTLTTRLGVQ
ncbi:MAG: hypothetical protein U5L07_07705 [Desulfobacterales bacterium]|nr:hypothetical protein [Desulfobacterales bacterium]